MSGSLVTPYGQVAPGGLIQPTERVHVGPVAPPSRYTVSMRRRAGRAGAGPGRCHCRWPTSGAPRIPRTTPGATAAARGRGWGPVTFTAVTALSDVDLECATASLGPELLNARVGQPRRPYPRSPGPR